MEFAGSLVGALLAILGALFAGYLLFQYERRVRERDDRKRLVTELIADLERNAYQLELQDDRARIEDPQVWIHSGMVTEYWWKNRGALDFLGQELQDKLRTHIYRCDDLIRVLQNLRPLNAAQLASLSPHPVRTSFSDPGLDQLRESNQEILGALSQSLQGLESTKVPFFAFPDR